MFGGSEKNSSTDYVDYTDEKIKDRKASKELDPKFLVEAATHY